MKRELQKNKIKISLILGVLFFSSPIFAAKVGRVVVDEGLVYQNTDTSSKVLARVGKNQPIAASNQPSRGFYRVKTKSGVLGWMLESDLEFSSKSRSQKKSKGLKRKFRVRVNAGLLVFKPKDLNNFLEPGVDVIANSIYYAGQFQYRLNAAFGLGLRAEYISKSRNIQIEGTGEEYTISVSSIPIMLGAEYKLFGSPKFFVSAAGDIGLGLGSKATAKLSTGTTPSEIKSSALAYMLRILADLSLSNSFSIGAEVGYRIMKTSAKAPTLGDGGSTIFGTSPPSLAVDFSGPLFGVGLAFKF